MNLIKQYYQYSCQNIQELFIKIHPLAENLKQNLAQIKFDQSTLSMLKEKIRKSNCRQRIFGTLIFIEVIVIISAFAIPEQGKILPLGKEVIEAYNLLKKTPTGRKLIKRVEKKTGGSFIYLTLGETEKDYLIDARGEIVKAVTRTEFQYYKNTKIPHSITVIANRDIIGSDPQKVAQSLAFELENVHYSFQRYFDRYGEDSPLAAGTKAKVMKELGLPN